MQPGLVRPMNVIPYRINLNKSERPVDALAVKKYQSLSDNLKSRDASASKKTFNELFIVHPTVFFCHNLILKPKIFFSFNLNVTNSQQVRY